MQVRVSGVLCDRKGVLLPETPLGTVLTGVQTAPGRGLKDDGEVLRKTTEWVSPGRGGSRKKGVLQRSRHASAGRGEEG